MKFAIAAVALALISGCTVTTTSDLSPNPGDPAQPLQPAQQPKAGADQPVTLNQAMRAINIGSIQGNTSNVVTANLIDGQPVTIRLTFNTGRDNHVSASLGSSMGLVENATVALVSANSAEPFYPTSGADVTPYTDYALVYTGTANGGSMSFYREVLLADRNEAPARVLSCFTGLNEAVLINRGLPLAVIIERQTYQSNGVLCGQTYAGYSTGNMTSQNIMSGPDVAGQTSETTFLSQTVLMISRQLSVTNQPHRRRRSVVTRIRICSRRNPFLDATS